VKLMKGDVVEDKHRLDSDSCKLDETFAGNGSDRGSVTALFRRASLG
jgi:hypothetical protein